MSTATLNVQLNPDSDALYRILSVCHRRGFEVVALDYRDAALALSVAGAPAMLSLLPDWLAALVDVAEVQPLGREHGSRHLGRRGAGALVAG